jgi:hypothetical protein
MGTTNEDVLKCATTPRIKVSQPTLKCAAWNIKRGFVIREAELKHLIESECLDIISISETDLYYQTEPPRIEGFKSIPTKRSIQSKTKS